MSAVAPMERVYERVRLVRGCGSRRSGRLCVMSFVALLAGEKHTDAPVTASSFIRHFAITLNDALPETERQRLKPFAPRILGTNDGLDAERSRLAMRMLAEEISPRFETKAPSKFVSAFVSDGSQTMEYRETDRVAIAVAKLLRLCATTAPTAVDSAWFWAKGIDLLDRLCDVSPQPRPFDIDAGQIERVESVLDRSIYAGAAARIAGGVMSRIRGRMITVLAKARHVEIISKWESYWTAIVCHAEGGQQELWSGKAQVAEIADERSQASPAIGCAQIREACVDQVLSSLAVKPVSDKPFL